MCELDFDGHCEVWEQRLIVKSRKDHYCHGCGGTISIGASYISHFSVFEGDTSSERMCLPCKTIMDAFEREHGRQVSPDSLFDFLRECLDEENWAIDDPDDLDPDDEEDMLKLREPSRLSDSGLRWKYAIAEIQARSEARRRAVASDAP